jgi:polysaccharide export outer membrane protein
VGIDHGAGAGSEDRTASLSGPVEGIHSEGYRLQPGDPVMIVMRGTENEQVEDILDPEGFIVLPFIGRFYVAGLTPSELEQKITKTYVPDYFRYLSVTVLIQTQRSVYVKGEVRAPTRYPFVQGMTLLRAVSAAGGPTDFANQKRVTISRGDLVLGPYSLVEILKDPSKDVLIEPEDVIDVPQKPW